MINLTPGKIYHHTDITKAFDGQNEGGMRKSNTTNTLHLISDHTKNSPYRDVFDGDRVYYCGMGQTGHQDINGTQNKTLNESNTNGVDVYLSEVFKKTYYTFRGRAKLINKPYQEEQLDKNGDTRNVWIFPLLLIDEHQPINKSELAKTLEKRIKKNNKLTADELLEKIKSKKGSRKPGKRPTRSNYFQRDENIILYSLLRAQGICELCDKSAPFLKPDGEGFLEVHHIQHLANNGDDSIENTVALCPNCHRKMHKLGERDDINKLESIHKYIN
jgi:5-methylcytosine-specific restriction protein A